MRTILFALLMVLCVPSVYSQVIKYKGIPVDGSFYNNNVKTQLLHKGFRYIEKIDNMCHLLSKGSTFLAVLENPATYKIWRIVEMYPFDDFSSAKLKFISLYSAIENSNNYTLENDFTEVDVNGEFYSVNTQDIKMTSMYSGSWYWYDYNLKGTTNQIIQVSLKKTDSYEYSVFVYYSNDNNKEKEEF